ncbi:tRNA pseudouridine(13) synthase TruD [Marinobacterium jannaschii]|uniref:tRNA pseudouridine(13) synthase TruD n=1 Tax=Marinobacterium jannaschii TaxID=64970 RepID=UPI0004802642|nr:tRNA pseudouridine(13) synthase TruD [Marinobacterium jannaschii]
MTSLPTDYSYLYGKPLSRATIRTSPEDFCVTEKLGFEPEGEGEHVFLYIRKRGENTDWVARQLANFAQVSPRDVSYAGKKDRHAVTEQWFCVKFPMRRSLTWSLFGGDSVEVLQAVRHPRKLRLGTLQGNRFGLRLRNVTDPDDLAKRLAMVRQGVPNYFGEQRFGFDYGNLDKGIALMRGEFKERQRHKKGLYISAVRSWLFNQLLSARIGQNMWQTLQPGDAMMLAGSQSCFVADNPEAETDRLLQADIHLTGPMWGRGELMSQGPSRDWELAQLSDWIEIRQGLEALGLKQERRALRLMPVDLQATAESDDTWWLEFDLPSGAFATSVLREIALIESAS